jgi:hypothetical protein
MLSSVANVIIWSKFYQVGRNIIIWDEMLSSGMNTYHQELMPLSGAFGFIWS